MSTKWLLYVLICWAAFAWLVNLYFRSRTPEVEKPALAPITMDLYALPTQDNDTSKNHIQDNHLPEHQEKEKGRLRVLTPKKLNDVWNRLLKVRGLGGVDCPIVVVPRQGPGRIAEFVVEKNGYPKVKLEQEALEIMEQMEPEAVDDAVAIILGHELGHLLEWLEFRNYRSCSYAQKTDGEISTDALEERNADLEGLFSAYLCGYTVHGLLPRLVANLYEGYNFSPNLSGYYSLWERQQMAGELDQELQRLMLLFETANALTVMDQFNAARSLYGYIEKARLYQGKEISNNLGMTILLQALPYYDKAWVLPVEQDWMTRLNRPDEPTKSFNAEKFASILRPAVHLFEEAIKRDREFPAVRLNLMCLYFLQEDYEKVREIFSRFDFETYSRSQPGSLVLQKAKLVMALTLAESREYESAKTLLAELQTEVKKDQALRAIVDWNLEVLVHKKTKPAGSAAKVPCTPAGESLPDREAFEHLEERIPLLGESIFSYQMTKKQDWIKMEDQYGTLLLARKQLKPRAPRAADLACRRVVQANRGYWLVDATSALRVEAGKIVESFHLVH